MCYFGILRQSNTFFMARTKDEIFDDLMTRKDASPVLAGVLSSNSKASFYQSLFSLYADITGDFELTFDDFKDQINYLLISKQVHTATWWRKISLEFQLGDILSIAENGNLYYPIIDVSKQIIKRAAISTTEAGAIRLKVAKLAVDEVTPIPLISSENAAFTSYINDTAPAGIAATIISVEGDEVRVGLDVAIDSQIINQTDGTLISNPSIKPVESAVLDYFATFQNDEFGGTFFANKLMQNILSTTGVINATFSLLEQKANGQTVFTDVLSQLGKKFVTFSGYVRIANGFILGDNITYTAEQ